MLQSQLFQVQPRYPTSWESAHAITLSMKLCPQVFSPISVIARGTWAATGAHSLSQQVLSMQALKL